MSIRKWRAAAGPEAAACLAGCLFLAAAAAQPRCVVEPARKIPLAKETDVLVVGGSSAAVAAALAAKSAGADVYLAAPRPYVGDDIAGTLRLSLNDGENPDSGLERALWLDDTTCLPFTYSADAPSVAPHHDRNGRTLCDGKTDDVVRGSVQFNVPKVKIDADLGAVRRVDGIELVTYRRRNDYGVQHARFVTSMDGKRWSEPAPLVREAGGTDLQRWCAKVDRDARFVGIAVFRRETCGRMLIGEISIKSRSGTAVRHVPTPLHVKRTFDSALLSNGVHFITGSYVTDVLRDGRGAVSGVVIANRGGRQAIRAKTVVDATDRATVARLAGAEFTPYPQGEQKFKRIVVSFDRPPDAPGMTVRQLPGTYRADGLGTEARDGRMWECELSIPMRDGSFASFAAAEQLARDRTFTAGQLDASDTLFHVPPDRISGSVPHLFVLGGCAPLSEAELRPLAFMRKGTEIGAAAARDAMARNVAAGDPVVVFRALGADGDRPPSCDIREVLAGFRPFDKGLPEVESPEMPLPVFGEYDVVVAGGGTAGAPAGIAAGRRGARTLVVECLYGLGGVGTLGMIGKYWYGNACGFTAEHDRGVKEIGAAVHVVGKGEWWRRASRNAGTELWFGAMACGTVMKDGRVCGIVVATPHGRGVALARNVVDATGNADVAATAGVECRYVGAGEITLQGAGLSERRLGASYTNSDWGYVNDGDAADLWLFGVRGRAGATSGVWDISQLAESRERRRIVGTVEVTPLDVVNGRTFPDTIAQGRSDFDSHGPSVDDICYVSEAEGKKVYGVNVPYRALLPKTVDGLAVAGLAISAHRDALPLMRMQADMQNIGYAAGAAAAMASATGKELRDIDVKSLQRHLSEKGVIPEEALEWEDNCFVDPERWAQAVRDVGDGYKGVSLVLTDRVRAVPALREAYACAKSPESRLVYAHVLGILGDGTGAETLARQIDGRDAKIEINARGLAAFGRRMSERDSMIVALGRTRSPLALDPLLAEAEKLDRKSVLSHVRAVALALEALGDRRAAPVLASVLAKPGVAGWSRHEQDAIEPSGGFGSSPEISRCMRELHLARALLACGDHGGTARRILESYARDVRGVFAMHARALLGGRTF